MKKAKSARQKSSSSTDITAVPSSPSRSTDESPVALNSGDTHSPSPASGETQSAKATRSESLQKSQGTQPRPQRRATDFQDIPEDALPPERPDPILSLQLSAALHSKLRYQAQDEGISVEALALEMLAESVVLRAWEIVERKSAMRGLAPGQGAGQPQGPYNRSGYNNSSPQGHGNSKHPRPQYGASSGQNHPQGQHGNRSQGYSGSHGRHQNNAWMEDKAAFLEYVRNQEKRSRR